MKTTILKTITLLICCIALNGCQNELDTYNNNPNESILATPSLLLSAMQVATFSNHTTTIVRTSCIFMQQLAGTSFGDLEGITNYSINEGDLDNAWQTLYGNTLTNGYLISRDFGSKNPYYNGMGQILTALNLGYATDIWGDVPFDEAFQGENQIKEPKYNTQAEIYQRLQSILDLAIENLNKPEASNMLMPTNDDLIFGGDIQKWIAVAYVLKARYALRLTEVDSNAAQKALDYISLSKMTSNSNDMNTYFTLSTTGQNQWDAFVKNRPDYLKMGSFFIENLKSSLDPRLAYMATMDQSNNYSGNTPEDLTSITTSNIGSSFASVTTQIGIVTFAEAKFIEAEAKLRLNRTGVKEVLEEAINASVLKTTETEASKAFLVKATSKIDLNTIISQKYTALFLTLEPYNDYRRTGFPELIPNQNSDTKKIPVRFPTPLKERIYNKNATVVSDLSKNVWWDKN